MDLFLDQYVPTFDKLAAEVELPEDPNRWPQELLQELHKQVSFISDFDPRIVMDRVDAEKGYGFGHFEVGNKMSDPNASPEQRQAVGARSARIPIIISEGRLKPFDLIINEDAKIFPLTETRLRQALFRPNMFDMAAKSPGDEGIIDRLYPPMRQSNGGASSMTVPGAGGMTVQSAAGMGKTDIEKEAGWAKALNDAHVRSQVVGGAKKAVERGTRTKYLRPTPIKKPGLIDKLLGRTKTAEEQFNDFVETGETKEPGFTAWDGQFIETAGEMDQRQRVRAEGDLEAAMSNDGVWGAVLSDQNRQAMGMEPKGPLKGTNGPDNYQKRQAVLHSIAGGHTKQAAEYSLGPIRVSTGKEGAKEVRKVTEKQRALMHRGVDKAFGKKASAMKLKIPEPEKIIEGQKADGYKPQYAGSMGPDGKIKKASSAMYWENNYEKDEGSGNYVPKNYSGDVRHVTFQHKGSGESRTFLMPKAHFERMQKDQGYKKMDRAKKAQAIDPNTQVSFTTAMRNIRQMPVHTRNAVMSALLEKKAGVGSVLTEILPTIGESDYLRFAQACEPESVKIAILKNTPAAEAIGKLAEWVPQSPVDVGAMSKQDVTQVSKLDDGTYRVKYASSKYWEPRTVIMDRGSLYDAIGKLATAVDLHGSITLTKNAQVEGDGPEVDKPEPIEDFGMYKVQTTEGQSVIGFAIPNLIDLDGTVLPLVLFTNGSASAVQGDMVGVRSGGEPNLPDGPAQGHGAFVRVRDNGKAEATTPIEIKAELQDEKGLGWVAEDFNGRPVTIRKQPNIQMPVKVDDVVLLPESFRWMPLGGESLHVVDGVEAFGKQADAVRHMLSVQIRGGSGAFSIDGPAVEKIAAEQKHFVDYDGAIFLLGGLGVAPTYAMSKLSEANYCGAPVTVRIGRTIKTAAWRKEQSYKTAGARITNNLPLYHREHLVKEAVSIPDPTAVDTVLSLGFLNSENVLSFINALPNVENAQSRMCEMLLGARLGLKEVPEGALEKAVQATEDVLEGLKVLAFQET